MEGNSNNTPSQKTLTLTPGTDFVFNFRDDQNSLARHGNDILLAFDPAAPIPTPPPLNDLEGTADQFNLDVLLGDFLEEDIAPEIFINVPPEITGRLGRDRFVLGDWRTPYYLDNFLLGFQQQAIVADFQTGLDTIQLHGFREDYTIIPFLLFGTNPQTGETDTVDGEALVWTGIDPVTQQSDFDIVAFFPDVPPGPGLPQDGLPLPDLDLDSDSFIFVGNTPPPGPAESFINQLGTIGVDAAYGVSVDPLGNVYVVGGTTGVLGEASQGSWDVWIAKFDNNGKQLWINQLGTGAPDISWDIETFLTEDNQVNFYVTGSTTGDLAIALGGSEPNEGYQDIWVARFDADGNVITARQNPQPADQLPPAAGEEIDNSLQIDVDSDGNLYQSGVVVELVDSPLTEVQDFSFVASYDTNLDLLNFDGTTLESTDVIGFDESYGIAVSDDGTVYATGFTQNNLGSAPGEPPRIGVYDGWLARFDENLNPIFVTKLGTINYDFPWGVDTDSNNNAYVAGFTRGELSDPLNINAEQVESGGFNENDAFLIKFDGEGNQLWARQFGTPGDDGLFLGDIVVDSDDGIYVTGFTEGDLGGPNQGGYDTWVAKYNTDGEQLWITQFGSTNLDMPTAIDADNMGSLFVTGFTEGSLGSEFQGATDAWVAKLNADTGALKPFNINPSIDIEKKINGKDADSQATALVRKPKKKITWTYEVTNTGNVAFEFDDISVTDDQDGIKPKFIKKSDQGKDRILSPGETWRYKAKGKAEDLTTVIDFEKDGNGKSLKAGTIIDDEYQSLGLTISTPENEFGAMILDGKKKSKDDDDFDDDDFDDDDRKYRKGSKTKLKSLKNVLIISEDGNSQNPDIDEEGGVFKFEWDELVIVNSVSILDIDGAGGEIRTFDARDELIGTYGVNTEDKSLQKLTIGDDMVMSLEIDLFGKGAVADVNFDNFYRNIGTVAVDGYSGIGDSDAAYYRNSRPNIGGGQQPGQFELNNGLVQDLIANLTDLPISSG